MDRIVGHHSKSWGEPTLGPWVYRSVPTGGRLEAALGNYLSLVKSAVVLRNLYDDALSVDFDLLSATCVTISPRSHEF